MSSVNILINIRNTVEVIQRLAAKLVRSWFAIR